MPRHPGRAAPSFRTARASAPPAAPPAADGALLAALAVSLVLPLAGAWLGTNWLWGLSVLAVWPAPLAAGLVALAGLGFVPPVAAAIERSLASIGRAWERHAIAGDLLVAAAVAALLYALRDPVRFVGDSQLRAGALTLDVPMARLFQQAFPLDLAVSIELPRALMGLGIDPYTALQVVGAAMGAAFTLAALAFVRAAGARGASLPAAAIVLLGGGYVVHFAGYDKYGPLLFGIAIAAIGALVVGRDARGAIAIAVGTSIGVLASRIGYAMVPAALITLAMAWRRGRGRAWILTALVVTLAVAGAMVPRTIAIVSGFDRAVHLPGGAEARTLAVTQAPDALVRITDGLNLLFLLVPVWLAGAAALIVRRDRAARGPSLAPVAIAGVGAQLAILFAIRARQGVARDWDAYSGVALVVALVAVAASIGAWSARTRAPAVTIALASAIAFWGLTASDRMQVDRIGAMLRSRPAWSPTAHAEAADNLGLRAYRLGQYEESARWFEDAVVIAPNPRYIHQAGLAYLGGGKLDQAWAAFARAGRLAPRNADPWIGFANVALARGDTLTAVAMLDSALARSPGQGNVRLWRQSLAVSPTTP